MDRRTFLMKQAYTAASVAAAACLQKSAFAQVSEDPPAQEEIQLSADINRNHGHSLALDIVTILRSYQGARDSGQIQFAIQGSSGHSHDVVFTFDQLTGLLADGAVTVESSMSVNHSHGVTVILTLPA